MAAGADAITGLDDDKSSAAVICASEIDGALVVGDIEPLDAAASLLHFDGSGGRKAQSSDDDGSRELHCE